MNVISIVSAGAAKALVARQAEVFSAGGRCTVQTEFGAVQAMKSLVMKGHPADVIVLTDTLIDELTDARLVVMGSRIDLGLVGTGIAVRRDAAVPSVNTPSAFRNALLGAVRIICPDPATATAGKVLMAALASMGIQDQVKNKLVYCISGYAAMSELARGEAAGDIGVMQMTEIVAHEGLRLAGPMPGDLQHHATYSVGLSITAQYPVQALEFIRLLTGDHEQLIAAGFRP